MNFNFWFFHPTHIRFVFSFNYCHCDFSRTVGFSLEFPPQSFSFESWTLVIQTQIMSIIINSVIWKDFLRENFEFFIHFNLFNKNSIASREIRFDDQKTFSHTFIDCEKRILKSVRSAHAPHSKKEVYAQIVLCDVLLSCKHFFRFKIAFGVASNWVMANCVCRRAQRVYRNHTWILNCVFEQVNCDNR